MWFLMLEMTTTLPMVVYRIAAASEGWLRAKTSGTSQSSHGSMIPSIFFSWLKIVSNRTPNWGPGQVIRSSGNFVTD